MELHQKRERLTARLLLVPSEGLHFLCEISNVEDLDEMITRGGEQPVTIAVPFQVHHGVLVSVYGSQTSAVSWIPQFDWLLVIFRATDQERLDWMPVDCLRLEKTGG